VGLYVAAVPMELKTLLNALVQGSETTTLAQIEPKSASPVGGALSGQPGLAIALPSSSLSGASLANPAGLTDSVELSLPPELTLTGQPGPSLPNAGTNTGTQTGLGPNGTGALAQASAAAFTRPGPGTLVLSAPGPAASTGSSPAAQIASAQAQRAGFATAGMGTEDVYHGSGAPAASASLLSQSGIGAYIHLLSTLASNESDQKSATLLTNNLGNASATLRASYSAALAALPPQLQQKDWSFSVANGALAFTAGKDVLAPQDLAELQKAFANANVAAPAREVAAAIASIQIERQSGAESSVLGWGALGSDDTNGGSGVNLRSYVTTTAPGGHYQPAAPDPGNHPEIPTLLGGMDLRHLESARPDFFRPDGTVPPAPEAEPLADATELPLDTLRGQCSCGEIQLLIENNFEYAYYCHCSRCRARTGSAFAAIAGISPNKVQVVAGSDHLLIEGECADGYGARCSRCHVFLFAAVRERRYLHISLGVLSGSPNRLPDHHIYVGSKAPWFEITDHLPQYDELPDPKPR
jgi:hypothetical protein